MAELTEKYGPLIRIHFGPTGILLVTDPVEVALLTSNQVRQDNLPKLKKAYFSLEFVSTSHHLMTAEHAQMQPPPSYALMMCRKVACMLCADIYSNCISHYAVS